MGVGEHLGIETKDYDRQILTFIPHYAEMLDEAVRALAAAHRPVGRILDLGTGTGALAARFLKARPAARVHGIDMDGRMLAMARARLGPRLTAVEASFELAPFPASDLVTASFAVHHVPTPRRRGAVYKRAFAALRPGGLLVNADSMTSSNPAIVTRDYAEWRDHLARFHGPTGARRFLRMWSHEDTYFTLDDELRLMRAAGFSPDVTWRRGCFAVVAALKPRGTRA